MSIAERDPHSGYMTTGHEWNGITELNTRVPRPVYFFLTLTFAFALIYWFLMPAWPLGWTYTKGLLGVDQRTTITQTLQQAAASRTAWISQIESQGFAQIQADQGLMQHVRGTAHRLFRDNCAACHGADARGGMGFPNLLRASLLWGDDPGSIAETIRVGINSTHSDSRVAQMPAFGRGQMLQRKEIESAAAYVRSLSNPSLAGPANMPGIQAGKDVFAANCAACHGEDAKGNRDAGVPDLSDSYKMFGADEQSVFNTIWNGHQGHMPTWDGRLSPVERKILALYLIDLRAIAPIRSGRVP